jgi:hypothetical protein
MAAKSPVSSEGYRKSRAERREFRGQSLLDEFSISEFQERRAVRPVARHPARQDLGKPFMVKPKPASAPPPAPPPETPKQLRDLVRASLLRRRA